MAASSSFWAQFKAYPPCVVRLMARTGKGPSVRLITLSEIAHGSGLTFNRVEELESKFSWAGVTIEEAEAFCRASQFDPTSALDRRTKDMLYLRTCERNASLPFGWLRKNQAWPRYRRIIQQWRASQTAVIA